MSFDIGNALARDLERRLILPVLLVVAILVALAVYYIPDVKAQAKPSPSVAADFEPYRFANVPAEPGIYKMQYQGCELFLAVGTAGSTGELLTFKDYPKSIAIATGRNCR